MYNILYCNMDGGAFRNYNIALASGAILIVVVSVGTGLLIGKFLF